MRHLLAVAAPLAAAVVLVACGGDDEPSATTDAAAAPAATTAATTPPAPAGTTAAPTATTGVPVITDEQKTGTQTVGEGEGESDEGGAGDEEPARVPVTLTHRDGALSPTTVTVPAFLTLAITISGPATTATLPGGATLAVPGTKTLAGLKPGKYAISTADGGKTTLNVVSGGDPGP